MTTDAFPIPTWSDLEPDPLDATVSRLVDRLASLDGPTDEAGVWSEGLWKALVESNVPSWSLPPGPDAAPVGRTLLLRRYARVAEGSLTAAFILSQHDAGVRRLVSAAGREGAQRWVEKVSRGEAFPTVGISQLTTSRRHGAQALTAKPTDGGFVLEGVMPWVTAAERADVFVSGAVLDDGRQVLFALPSDRAGLEVRPAFPLAALQASCTAEVACRSVRVEEADLLAGPTSDVMANPGAAGTGGLETSALALGLAHAALVALASEAPRRADLGEPVEALSEAWSAAWDDMNMAALGLPEAPSPGAVRGQANSVALRPTQACLTARKGTGFLRTEPAQRWARQALFFLVWSCPGPVAQAAIRDLAGLCEA